MPAVNEPMPRRDRLRRVVMLCCFFARNLAYYRAGREPEFASLLNPASKADANFWRAVNSNGIDISVLEWCKLFADAKGKHFWANVVTDGNEFETELHKHLGVDAAGFKTEIEAMRGYRDKFLAHLDSEYVMNIPRLDIPRKAVWFYLDWIVRREAASGDLTGLPMELDSGYEQAEKEARAVYARNIG
jgi:hypothetical protein